MEKKANITGWLLMALLVLSTGCKMGSTMSSSGVPAKYLETFFKGEGAELYFVKPFDWKPEDGKEWVNLDITMDYNRDSIQKPLTVNFTFFCEKAATDIDEVKFTFDSGSKTVTQLEQIYIEKDPKHKKFYKNRHTFQLPYEDFKALIASEEPTFALTTHGTTYEFGDPKKWNKRRPFLQEYMVDMIELNK